jgi:GT2 family glycosyltransferase
MPQTSIGIVVPTMGTRPDYLRQCLASIRSAGHATIHIIAPESAKLASVLDPNSFDALVIDPGTGLSAAIDAGMRSFPPDIKYINWLGDDDLLVEGSLRHASAILNGDPDIALIYGGCEYIDGDGKSLWHNNSGSYAKYLMRCGPQLIPQPGSLMRRDAYEKIGGLDHQYKWAFDLDLLIRLSRVGRLQFTPRTLAMFRWHEGSLSVGGRRGSVDEASAIRKRYLPQKLKFASELWESPIRQIILRAGANLTIKQVKSNNRHINNL